MATSSSYTPQAQRKTYPIAVPLSGGARHFLGFLSH
jgi:hypothetical protein